MPTEMCVIKCRIWDGKRKRGRKCGNKTTGKQDSECLLEQRQQEVKLLGGPVSAVTKFLTKLRIIVEMEEARVLKTALPPPLCDQGGQVTMIVFAFIAGLYF